MHCGSGLLGRPVSESGRTCHWDGAHEGGARRRRALMLPILSNSLASPRTLSRAFQNRTAPARAEITKSCAILDGEQT